MRLCDICRVMPATRVERVVEGGLAKEYAYCEGCYQHALSLGQDPCERAKERLARIGLECPSCGYTAEEFEHTGLFGCPDCYAHMSGVAQRDLDKLAEAGGVSVDEAIRSVKDIVTQDICIDDFAVSSRIRLARDVEGLPFPGQLARLADDMRLLPEDRDRMRALLHCAMLAAGGVFEGDLYEMSELDDLKKKMLVERHIISPPLAQSELGAVIIERGEKPEISIMINEEDHIRAQCVRRGLDLAGAYGRLTRYDRRLSELLPIARDERWGYLTACPTNVGTGLRASVMMFLPALRCIGELESTLMEIKRWFGLTVRGYYGEGSGAAFDMYQVSNGSTLRLGEEDSVRLVECAALELCRREHAATRELVGRTRTKLFDRLHRSYGTLLHAHTLEADEMAQLLADVRLGVRLGIFDIDLRQVDGVLDDCATAFEILSEGLDDERRGVKRAQIVRQRLGAKW